MRKELIAIALLLGLLCGFQVLTFLQVKNTVDPKWELVYLAQDETKQAGDVIVGTRTIDGKDVSKNFEIVKIEKGYWFLREVK